MRLEIFGESSHQSNVTIGNKGKQTSGKKQYLEKMPNKVKIKNDENYYKNGSNVN